MTEIMIEWMKDEFNELADDHFGTASNIHIAALGTEDDEEAAMSEEFADAHRELAKFYRMIAKNPQWLLDRLNGGM